MSKPRFRHEIDPSSGCWIWQGAVSSSGYGNRWVEGKTVLAHRFYYEELVGTIPSDLQIDHLCRNKLCVNPEHLEAVRPAVNTRRGLRSKLDKRAVEFIRSHPDFNGEELAKKFGVNRSTICHVRRGRVWK